MVDDSNRTIVNMIAFVQCGHIAAVIWDDSSIAGAVIIAICPWSICPSG